jgi:hypothetical protein
VVPGVLVEVVIGAGIGGERGNRRGVERVDWSVVMVRC